MPEKSFKKETEGLYEKYLLLFFPIWLPIEALKIMIAEIRKERSKREERESRA
jgi:hypothetical protein